MEKSRITSLADGIFAVAMTLLVLNLKIPEEVRLLRFLAKRKIELPTTDRSADSKAIGDRHGGEIP
jgi:uncharacterized membrane protein